MSAPGPDISTADARRLLQRPAARAIDDEVGPRGWTRRRFLQAVGAGVLGGAALGTIADDLFGGDLPEAWAGAPAGPNDGILVLITMYGGNDSLNTWVPYTDPTYAAKRANIAISPARVLPVDDRFGFHPQLTYLKALYDAGQVGVVQGLGYPNPDLSHFTSMAIWMAGRFGGGAATTGWIGRWLDGMPAGTGELGAACVDTSVPLHMSGAARRAVAVSEWGGMFGTGTDDPDRRMYDGMRALSAAPSARGAWHDMYASTLRQQLDLANEVAPVFADQLPDGELTRRLTVAARLINVDVGLRVIDVSASGFDNHEREPADHEARMRDLDAGLRSFFSTLAPQHRSRVTLMTVSEFGRTVGSNDTQGTDHGTTATQFVIGANVRGGQHGWAPSLTNLDRDGRLISSVDFRALYGSVVDGWLGGGGSTVVNGGFEDLRLFRAGPGQPSAGQAMPIVVAPTRSKQSGYVPLTPTRVFDTRDGTGGRSGPLGAGETWTFSFAGAFAVPDDTVAVVLNLTSVDATEPTFVTVWPTAEPRPSTANLNPVPGMAVPNMCVGRLGPGASIELYNLAGSVHLVGDLVGYYRNESSLNLRALTPARLLDTREGIGGATGRLGEGRTIELQVGGRAGVSPGTKAVALNVTVTEPSAASFLTVFPTGTPMPLAASVNMVAGQTVANMVIATVGAGGKVSIFNSAGATHVVADVLGSFEDGATGRFVALTPSRVLDTREGRGAPRAPIGQHPLRLQLRGVDVIPADGVTSVLLNVTAVSPTAATFLTVHPSDQPRPNAANLNAVAGQVVPNTVLARLAPDGTVSIFNYAGAVDVVADVMGYFVG